VSAERFDGEDPKFSAYVLGELSGPENDSIETLLAESAEARQWVQELRDVTERLSAELHDEPMPALAGEQRARLEARIGPRRSGVWKRRLLACAASTLFALSLGAFFFWRNRQPESSEPFLYTIFGDAPATVHEARRVEGLRGLGYLGGYEKTRASGSEAIDLKGFEIPLTRDRMRAGDDSREMNTEDYAASVENAFRWAENDPLSTFSIDVDTASYSNMRRFLNDGRLPPPSSVRIEELINYFSYDYPPPRDGEPFSITTEVASAPWQPNHRLVHIGLRAEDVAAEDRPDSNLVFLIDVSGSMQSDVKLPLLKRSMRLLIDQLGERDRVALVVYAGSSGLVLPSTSCVDKWAVLDALDRLEAGGSTNGAEGIGLAYQVALEHFLPGGLNRVILCTDGDFNVGVTDQGSLVKLIEKQRESGVFLSVLGFGTGNLKDSTMEQLADKGNGNYAYIDSVAEARKVLVSEMGGTLLAVAKDVKIQVEFNPAEVQAWRLIGYENRLLADQDFDDDEKDAGEIGAGLSVTALYEVVPHGVPFDAPRTGELRYRDTARETSLAQSGELLHLRLRYKPVSSDESLLLGQPVRDGGTGWYEASDDFKFSAAVAAFGMFLSRSAYLGDMDLAQILTLAAESRGDDLAGYRAEFLGLVERAERLR
jgi:Ca-activated chloride channel family protein